MKNTLKTTLFVLAGFTALTLSAQTAPVKPGAKTNVASPNMNKATDGKTINSTSPTNAKNATTTNLKGQNDVSATQSSSAKPGATSTSITSSKVNTSNSGSTSTEVKKGVETRRRR